MCLIIFLPIQVTDSDSDSKIGAIGKMSALYGNSEGRFTNFYGMSQCSCNINPQHKKKDKN